MAYMRDAEGSRLDTFPVAPRRDGMVGTRVLTNRMGTFNNSSMGTFHVITEVAQHYDAVRLVFANTSANLSDWIVAVAASAPSSAADLNNSSGTWVTGTKNGYTDFGTAIAPATPRIAYTVTDWISLKSVARTDGGVKPLVALRAYIDVNGVLPVYGAGSDYTNWASRTDGWLWASRYQTGNQVSTPSGFTSTTNTSQSAIIGVQYLARGKVITVGAVGDSITDGAGGTYIGEGFILPAVKALTNPSGVAVEYANFGWAGQLHASQYALRALDILESDLRPDILLMSSGSPNDTGGGLTSTVVNAYAGTRAAVITACADRRVTPILWTMLPCNTSVHAWAAADSLRTADNAQVLARNDILTADTATVMTGVDDGTGQLQIKAGYTTDGIHPNDTGNAAIVPVVQSAIAAALRRTVPGRSQAGMTPFDIPIFVTQHASTTMSGGGFWEWAGGTAGTWNLAAMKPANRASKPQVYYVKVKDTAAPLTITARPGDTFKFGGASVSSITLQPGEGAVIFGDGTDWATMLITAVVRHDRVKSTAAATLTLDKTAGMYSFTGSAATTWTLPAVANNTGLRYTIKNRGSAAITLNSNAGGADIYTTATVTSVTVAAGASMQLVNDGTSWVVL